MILTTSANRFEMRIENAVSLSSGSRTIAKKKIRGNADLFVVS